MTPKKIGFLLIAIISSIITFFYIQNSKEVDADAIPYNIDNMVGYDTKIIDSRFTTADLKTLKSDIDMKNTALYFFSFPGCPYCETVLPVLQDLAKKEDVYINYIDITKYSEEKESEDYQTLIHLTKDILIDDKSIMYVPELAVLQNGKFTRWHLGVDENFIPKQNHSLTKAEKTNLMMNYQEVISIYKSNKQ